MLKISKSSLKNNGKCNGTKEKDKKTNKNPHSFSQKTKDWATRTQLKSLDF